MRSVWAVNGCVDRAVRGFVASTSGETEGWRAARSPANLGSAGKAVNQALCSKNIVLASTTLNLDGSVAPWAHRRRRRYGDELWVL